MNATISAATGKSYGIQRVCDTWEMPHSSFYDRKARRTESPVILKRCPKTLVSDDDLLALIRHDLVHLIIHWRRASQGMGKNPLRQGHQGRS